MTPIGCVEVVPGDTFKHATSALIRVAPMATPVMHPVHARIHHWFVPTRLIWQDFEDFITGGPDGNNASAIPNKTWAGAALVNSGLGSLNNHLGVPPLLTGSTTLNILRIRAYNLIFNEWYRDQDLQTELVNSTASGADTTSNVVIQNINWEKDYFTTARPWAAKGTAVTIPVERASNAGTWKGFDTGTNTPSSTSDIGVNAGNVLRVTGGVGMSLDPNGGLVINPDDLRLGMALMRYKEARAQWGSRYTEYLRYLGINPSDARLQRPEYLGGGQQTIQFSEVLQTAPDTTDGDSGVPGVGNLYGHGIGSTRSNKYMRFFEEHGFVLSLLSVKPRTMYANAIPRDYLYATKEDFFQRELQFIGQQEISNREVKVDHASPTAIFGWQDRYDHLRQVLSQVSGEFSPGGSQTDWHMARIFGTDPALNSTFVQSNPTNRIYADTNAVQLQVMAYHNLRARRIVSQRGGNNHVY